MNSNLPCTGIKVEISTRLPFCLHGDDVEEIDRNPTAFVRGQEDHFEPVLPNRLLERIEGRYFVTAAFARRGPKVHKHVSAAKIGGRQPVPVAVGEGASQSRLRLVVDDEALELANQGRFGSSRRTEYT